MDKGAEKKKKKYSSTNHVREQLENDFIFGFQSQEREIRQRLAYLYMM
jgi:hypothetical protein